jgi:hypothetical protein
MQYQSKTSYAVGVIFRRIGSPALFRRIGSPAVVACGLALTLGWVLLLGYAVYRLVTQML